MNAVTKKEINKPMIEEAVRNILVALGENPDREGLIETPKRVAKAYAEIFDGINYTNASGMLAGISNQSTFGVQINSSSRFEANGGSYPITLTYTNLRFKRE